MKKLLLPFVSALLLAACSSGSPVTGAWILDGGATAAAMETVMQAQMKGAEGPEAEMMKKAVLDGIKQGMSKMRSEIDIEGDGTFTVHNDAPDGSHTHVHGKWTLQGSTITFTGKADNQEKPETYSGTVNGEEMRLEMQQGDEKMTMVFRRKK